MKLLFDQNLSFKLKKKLQAQFPGSMHVSDQGLINVDDIKVWEYARRNDYIIVTCDADFFDIMLIKGFPPKVIWIKKGNSSTDSIYEAIKSKLELITKFEGSPDSGCLEIY